VQLAIAGTGPMNYLILIGHVDLLPRMLKKSPSRKRTGGAIHLACASIGTALDHRATRVA
jgi:hypothetical protein